jgi:hypothetical protein
MNDLNLLHVVAFNLVIVSMLSVVFAVIRENERIRTERLAAKLNKFARLTGRARI